MSTRNQIHVQYCKCEGKYTHTVFGYVKNERCKKTFKLLTVFH